MTLVLSQIAHDSADARFKQQGKNGSDRSNAGI